MDQPLACVLDHQRGLYTMTDLCTRDSISPIRFKRKLLFHAIPVRRHYIGLRRWTIASGRSASIGSRSPL